MIKNIIKFVCKIRYTVTILQYDSIHSYLFWCRQKCGEIYFKEKYGVRDETITPKAAKSRKISRGHLLLSLCKDV